jgi:hypothetical protein
MQLLLKRSQKAGVGGRIKFDLWAKFELTAEEQALIDKYQVRNAILDEGNTRRDLIRAFKYAIGVGILALILLDGVGVSLSPGLMVLGFAALTYAIYQQIREQIRVSDILTGRTFTCRSVLTLMEKERTITQMAVVFRQFLEAMKTWGGAEVINIEPALAPTVRVIEEPARAAS